MKTSTKERLVQMKVKFVYVNRWPGTSIMTLFSTVAATACDDRRTNIA
jgi:hypothetical protein